MAVVIVPETYPYSSPEFFAARLFNYWGIGKSDQNNGILLLVSVDDRRVEIKTGSGIVALLPNAKLQWIIDHDILPQLRRGNFSKGIWLGTQSLIQAIHTVPSQTKPVLASSSQHRSRYDSLADAALLIAGVITVLVALLYFVVWGITIAFQPAEVEPEGRSLSSSTGKQRDNSLNCVRCKLSMIRVDPQILLTSLTPAQRIAQELGGVAYEGWQCSPECKEEIRPAGVHLREYLVNKEKFKRCPDCKERTMERSIEIIKPATRTKEGKQLVRQYCRSCSLTKEYEEAIKPGYPVYDADGSYIGSVAYSSDSSSGFGGGGCDGGGGAGGGF